MESNRVARGIQAVKTSFRKASPNDIRNYICNVGRDRHNHFLKFFQTVIKSNVWVKDEESITLSDPSKLPIGVIYEKGHNEYAMGVCKSCGTYKLDDFTITIQKTIEYSMWGPYQRTGWSIIEIKTLLGWRKHLMEQPMNIYGVMIPKFERSRWMLFCFWPGDIEELITLEMQLMDNIFEQNALEGGVMKSRLLKRYNTNMKGFRDMIKNQYRTTTFSLNDEEKRFIQKQVWLDQQVKQIYKV
tara:strand:- start:2117 stop:2845 length:729 start_codon:yes stop_codon:yes gene_type:complete